MSVFCLASTVVETWILSGEECSAAGFSLLDGRPGRGYKGTEKAANIKGHIKIKDMYYNGLAL